jgi:hypothetical protein
MRRPSLRRQIGRAEARLYAKSRSGFEPVFFRPGSTEINPVHRDGRSATAAEFLAVDGWEGHGCRQKRRASNAPKRHLRGGACSLMPHTSVGVTRARVERTSSRHRKPIDTYIRRPESPDEPGWQRPARWRPTQSPQATTRRRPKSSRKYTEVPCEFRVDLGQQTTGFFVNAEPDPVPTYALLHATCCPAPSDSSQRWCEPKLGGSRCSRLT